MVWQSPSGHNAAADAAAGNNAPVGAEYTLQGVMRFLQTEWHKHERDRNNWEIERAEMKARIAKLEGDKHKEMRMAEVYHNRVKVLEKALKVEREKRKIVEAGGKATDRPSDQFDVDTDKLRDRLQRIEQQPTRKDDARHKSREWLEKCLQEITYLLQPPNHPPPQQQQQQQGVDINSLFPPHGHPQYDPTQQHPPNPNPSPTHQPPPPPQPRALDRTSQPPFELEIRPEAPPAHPNVLEETLNAAAGVRADSNPFSASENATPTDTLPDVWDFDDKPEDAAITVSAPQRRASDAAFKVKFALRGHLDVVRAVVFTGGTPDEPELASAGDEGVIKRWIVPASQNLAASADVDVTAHFTHRGHTGKVLSLAASPAPGFLFSGGVDATIKIWEPARVDPVATLTGHTSAVWAVCVLPTPSTPTPPDRLLLASGAADGTVKIWSITPAHPVPPPTGFDPTTYAPRTEIRADLITTITRPDNPAPTCIAPMAPDGSSFLVSYTDASILIFDAATGAELARMQSADEHTDGTRDTAVNAVVATTAPLDGADDAPPTVISAHENQLIKFYDGSSGQCTYTMLAHPAAISSLALSPDGAELVSAGHDASLRFWDMRRRACRQEMVTHRLCQEEGVTAVRWSADGRWVVSAGGDGVVKVYCR